MSNTFQEKLMFNTNSKRFAAFAVASALAVLASGCSSVKLADDQAGVKIENRGDRQSGSTTGSTGTGSASTGSVGSATATDPSRVGQVTLPGAAEEKALMDKRSIYFEYDSFALRAADQRVLEAHARSLLAAKGKKVLIQGNTDERGTSEYNLALGQKRAETVRKALAALGVPDTQMEAVSLGKEKPKSTAATEEGFAENRRADLVY
jgi:peptidoglycan-associated lipoprotein